VTDIEPDEEEEAVVTFTQEDVDQIAQESGLAGREERLGAILRRVEAMHEQAAATFAARQDPPKRNAPVGAKWKTWAEENGLTSADYDLISTAPAWVFKRPRGRPSHEPLRLVYEVLGAWWEDTTGRPWAPRFERREADEADSPDEWCTDTRRRVTSNDAARLFLLTVRCLNPEYTVENCYSVTDKMKQDRKSPAAREKRREWNRNYAKKTQDGSPGT
jgi:hypothetical protein